MKNFFLHLSNFHSLVMKLLLVVASAFIITLFFPLSPKFHFEIRKGGIWNYANLEAPFDFAILKPEQELLSERKVITENSPVVFRFNSQSVSEQTELFEKACTHYTDSLYAKSVLTAKEKKSKAILLTDIHHAGDVLKEIYSLGIGDETATQNSTFLLFRDSIIETSDPSKILSEESARQIILKRSLKWNPELKDFLIKLLVTHIKKNIEPDDEMTTKFLDDALASVSLSRGMVLKGSLIISKGEQINDLKFQLLTSFRDEYYSRHPASKNIVVALSYFTLVLLALSLLVLFLFLFRKDIFEDNKKIFFLLFLLFIISSIYSKVVQSGAIHSYIVPLCILPLVIRTFFDTRLALYSHLVLVLILGFIAPDGFEFAFIQLTSGMVAIFSIVNLRNRSQFFISSGLIFLTSSTGWLAISIIQEGNLSLIPWENLYWLAGSALLTLLAYPLIYISEKTFGFISDVSLLELSDSNTPILRELASKAPGTFQHSLQVSNLAEAVIYQIGGNPLMVRAGALYHDLGKMVTPMYFIENQNTSVNPHDELTFEESASVIISHVIHGIEIAKKNNLPEQLIDFIRTHHGTTMVQYFYRSFLKNFPEEVVDENLFRYPGPIPFSKETAVLMMADSVEAAARSLKKTDEQTIENLVESVIENLVSEKQFNNCNITFRDLAIIKKTFRKMLSSIYHSRVEYPK